MIFAQNPTFISFVTAEGFQWPRTLSSLTNDLEAYEFPRNPDLRYEWSHPVLEVGPVVDPDYLDARSVCLGIDVWSRKAPPKLVARTVATRVSEWCDQHGLGRCPRAVSSDIKRTVVNELTAQMPLVPKRYDIMIDHSAVDSDRLRITVGGTGSAAQEVASAVARIFATSLARTLGAPAEDLFHALVAAPEGHPISRPPLHDLELTGAVKVRDRHDVDITWSDTPDPGDLSDTRPLKFQVKAHGPADEPYTFVLKGSALAGLQHEDKIEEMYEYPELLSGALGLWESAFPPPNDTPQ